MGFDPAAPYAQRVSALTRAGIAVWDVCHSAHRPGSLDSDIAADSVITNDFVAFFVRYPGIERIGLNGAMACRLFERLVVPTLDAPKAAIPRVRLPSTSPAHAAMSLERKLWSWEAFLQPTRACEKQGGSR